jgi:hypothetical protein
MELAQKAGRLKILGPASLIYAVFFTFCLYENWSGITVPFAAAGTLVYFRTVSRNLFPEKIETSGGWFLAAAIVLLGISSCLTDCSPVIFMNAAGGFLLLLVYVLHFYYPDAKWNVGQQLSSMFCAVFGAVGCLFAPFTDLAGQGGREAERAVSGGEQAVCGTAEKKPSGNGRLIFIGIIITVPILAVVLLLLSAADAVFGTGLKNLFGNLYVPENLPGILLMTLFAFFASYCGIVYLQKGGLRKESRTGSGEPLPFIVTSGAVLAVYLIFSAVQMIFLFLHRGSLPAHMTYAEYAHQGFYQLLAVCILNMLAAVVCTEHLRESKVLRRILAGISLCTYVMLASAAYRMILYIGAYDLTFLRLFVLFALALLAVLMGGVMVSIFRPCFHLFRFALVTVTVLYLIFSFARPDYWIARYNLSAGNSDSLYFSELSADSVPAYAGKNELPEEAKETLAGRLRESGGDFRKFNFSRAAAEDILK